MSRYKQRKLDELYATLPTVECKGLCHGACGVVTMSREEWKRICDRLGHAPKGDETLRCPMLDADNRCSVYDIRPLICRLYGVADGLPCEHGCMPSAPLSEDDARAAIKAAWDISEGVR
jgi:uncharacterized protein